MVKLMQEIMHPVKGDCLRACVASLLDMDIKTVPNFCALFPDDNVKFGWFELFYYWMWHMGYLIKIHENIKDIQYDYKGINGYTIVSVQSTMPDKTHACIYSIEDKKIVHDPDPAQLVKKYKMPIVSYYEITVLPRG